MLSIKSPLEHERRQAKASSNLSSPGHIDGPPKLAPLERLPKRHRVGPSASLDEYRNQLIVARVYHRQEDMSILHDGGDAYSLINLTHYR